MGSGQGTLGPPKVVNIEDLRRLAHRRLPRPVFDYVDGGAEDELTLRENTRAFHDISFRPRGAMVIKKCDLTVRVLGHGCIRLMTSDRSEREVLVYGLKDFEALAEQIRDYSLKERERRGIRAMTQV